MKDITTEEAIEMLDKFITEHKFYNIKQSDGLEDNIEKVLNELEKYKELYVSTLGHTLNNSIAQSNKAKDDLEALNEGWKIELEKKDKIIDAMALQLSGIVVWDFEKDEPVLLKTEDGVKQYFERKIEDD